MGLECATYSHLLLYVVNEVNNVHVLICIQYCTKNLKFTTLMGKTLLVYLFCVKLSNK